MILKMKIPEEKLEASKFAGLEFTYWASQCLAGYLPVFLQSIGYSATMVGLVNAVKSAVGIVSGPVWGILSDKMQSVKRTVIICIACSMVLQVFIPSTSLTVFGISLIIAYNALVSFFLNPSMILLDSWVIQSSHRNKFAYGPVRSMGSLSWAVTGIIISLILTRTGFEVKNTFFLSSLMMIPVIILALNTRDSARDEGTVAKVISFKDMNISDLFKNYYFLAYFVYSFLINSALTSGYSFLYALLKDIGEDINLLGLVLGISTLMQFTVLMLVKSISRRFPLYRILIIGNCLTGIQYLLFSVATANLSQMMMFSIFNGIGSALMIATGANYVYLLAPNHLKATAQQLIGAVNSIAGIFGNIMGGIIIDRLGVKSFFLIVAVWIAVSVILFIFSFVIGKKKFPIVNRNY